MKKEQELNKQEIFSLRLKKDSYEYLQQQMLHNYSRIFPITGNIVRDNANAQAILEVVSFISAGINSIESIMDAHGVTGLAASLPENHNINIKQHREDMNFLNKCLKNKDTLDKIIENSKIKEQKDKVSKKESLNDADQDWE